MSSQGAEAWYSSVLIKKVSALSVCDQLIRRGYLGERSSQRLEAVAEFAEPTQALVSSGM